VILPYDLSVKRDDGPWNLQELADRSGVSARTIRYYIARGALDGPSGAGRSASYGPRHVERLREIQRRQDAGETLTEISRGPVALKQAAAPESWWRFSVSTDVVVEVRQNLAPWRMNRVREALEEMVRRLKEDDK
jgi:DNA-binding transcriptional MerR regulator